MKNLILSVVLLLISTLTFAQGIGINANGNVAAANAILDVSSTTKGMLIPRMTTAQKTALTPGIGEDGMLVYDLDTESYWFYDVSASKWIPFLSNSASNMGGWSLTGNAGTTAGANFIGTTDTVDWVIKTNNSEAVRVDQNGNVGIGTSGPTKKLHVQGAIISRNADGAGNDIGRIYGGLDNNDYIEINSTGVLDFMSFWVNSEAMRITTTGDVGIGTTSPTQKLHVLGNGLFSGTVTASCGVLTCSDKRYKRRISPLEGSLAKVLKLEGVSYFFKSNQFKDKNFNTRKQIGVIAQDVEQVYPELVSVDQDGFKSVSYAKITPILIEAIKEQQQMIAELKEENKLLRSDNILTKAENAAINERLSTIESILNETSKK